MNDEQMMRAMHDLGQACNEVGARMMAAPLDFAIPESMREAMPEVLTRMQNCIAECHSALAECKL